MTRTLVEIIAHFALLLEFSDESTLSLEAAVKQQEDLAFRLQQLSPAQRQEFATILREIAAGLPHEEQRQYLLRLPETAGIG